MARELSPLDVAARLRELRQLYTPESAEEGRARLVLERPAANEPFAKAVARRLAELRALTELADYLSETARARRGARSPQAR